MSGAISGAMPGAMSGRPEAPRHRLLIDLRHLAAELGGLAAATELAGLLDLDLVGVFVEEEALQSLASLPFARELRLPGHEWLPLAGDRLMAELARADDRLRQRLTAEAERRGIAQRFEVVRGDALDCVAGLAARADILVLGAPASAAARALGGFPAAWDAALACEASVLVLPSRLARRGGPVVAVVGQAGGDHAVLAARLALAASESLHLLLAPGTEDAAGMLAESLHGLGLPAPRLRIDPLARLTPDAVGMALGHRRERVIVLDRRATDVFAQAGAALRLAELRQVPLLLCKDGGD